MPQEPELFTRPGFKWFIEQTIREETPAHLTPYVHWLEEEAWADFQSVYLEWRKRRREYWSEKLGTPLEESA